MVMPCCLLACPLAGSGADEDIVVASARAYISALNKMIGWMSASGVKLRLADKPYPRPESQTKSVAVPL